MEKEYVIVKIKIFIMVNIKMILETVKELQRKKMEIGMKENGVKIKFMDMGNFHENQEIIIQENGK